MKLHTTHLTCLYQKGYLRYIHYEGCEVIRMIYVAVRNDQWLTAEVNIVEEYIDQQKDYFTVSYRAIHRYQHIDYEVVVKITGSADNQISFSFEGKALSAFQSNRIGICVLHPVRTCAGQPVAITTDNGHVVKGYFPTSISPHQPFTDIREMSWTNTDGIQANLTFNGDLFESEDQRNWSDHSYKTYSTPLSIPIPVQIRAGDRKQQSVNLQITSANVVQNLVSLTKEQKFRFPLIGYGYTNDLLLTDALKRELSSLPFDYITVNCHFEPEWIAALTQAVSVAQQLQVKVQLILHLSESALLAAGQLATLVHQSEQILHLLCVGENGNLPQRVHCEKIRELVPGIPLIVGTDAFFANINRQQYDYEGFRGIAFSLTPQVHLSDDLTIIENLQAQQDILETLAERTTLPVFICPVTLKWRYHPENVDSRQHSALVAAWTGLCLKYLAGVAGITFYELAGTKGVIPSEDSSPVNMLLKEIQSFQPVWVIRQAVNHPLEMDALILENAVGERRVWPFDWSMLVNKKA